MFDTYDKIGVQTKIQWQDFVRSKWCEPVLPSFEWFWNLKQQGCTAQSEPISFPLDLNVAIVLFATWAHPQLLPDKIGQLMDRSNEVCGLNKWKKGGEGVNAYLVLHLTSGKGMNWSVWMDLPKNMFDLRDTDVSNCAVAIVKSESAEAWSWSSKNPSTVWGFLNQTEAPASAVPSDGVTWETSPDIVVSKSLKAGSLEPECNTTVKFVPQVTPKGIKPDLDENSETNLWVICYRFVSRFQIFIFNLSMSFLLYIFFHSPRGSYWTRTWMHCAFTTQISSPQEQGTVTRIFA